MSDCHSIGGTWPGREDVAQVGFEAYHRAAYTKTTHLWSEWQDGPDGWRAVADAMLALFRPVVEENARTIAALRVQLATVTLDRDSYRAGAMYWCKRFDAERSDG